MSNAASDIGTEIVAIEETMGTVEYTPEVRTRYRQLIEARDRGGSRPAAPTASGREIAAIEAKMGTPGYDRNPALRARYRELIAAREKRPAGAGNARGLTADLRAALPASVVKEWDAAGSDSHSLERAQQAIQTIGQGIGNEQQAKAFATTFRALPDRAKAAVWRELGRPGWGYVKPASPEEMAAFRQQDGGPDMIAAWGRQAQRRVGIFLERHARLLDSMSASDRSAWSKWLFDRIGARERMTVLWVFGSAQ